MKKNIFVIIFIALLANLLFSFEEQAQYVNIALGKPTVASSSHSEKFASKNAVDGNLETCWASQIGDTKEYLYVDLGTKVEISGITLKWKENFHATNYSILYSDDAKNWTTAYTDTLGDGSKLALPLTATCRYIGVRCRQRFDRAFAITRFGVYIKDDYVKASGNKLLKNGSETIFKGISFTNFYYDDNIEDAFGGKFTNIKHHRQEDFTNLKSLGFNTIRFALNADWFEDDVTSDSKELWTWIDQSLKMAEIAEINVIIDMHEPVGQSWLSWDALKQTDMNDPVWMWNDPAKIDKLVRIWDALAQRYQYNRTIVGLQILNEPMTSDFTGEKWFGNSTSKGLAQTLVETVRNHDKHHLIIMDNYCGTLKAFPSINEMAILVQVKDKKFNDPNMLYDKHFYEMGYYTHKAAKWGGGIDNGSIYTDETAPLGKPIWDNHNKANSYTWSRLAATGVTNTTHSNWTTITTGEYSPNSTDVVLDCKAVVQGVLGANNTVLFDNFVLWEKKAGSSKFEKIRDVNPNRNLLYGSNKDTEDGFHGWIEAGTESDADKKYTEDNSFGLSTEGNGDTVSLKITDNKVKAVWNQSWSNIAVNQSSTYKFSIDVKVIGTVPSGVTYGPLMEAVKDPTGIIVRGFNKTALKDYIEGQIIKFQIDNNLPKSFCEFGAMLSCFTDPKTGINYGGAQWLKDVISIYEENNASWIFWAFRNDNMGIFNKEDYKQTTLDYIDWSDPTHKNLEIFQTIETILKP